MFSRGTLKEMRDFVENSSGSRGRTSRDVERSLSASCALEPGAGSEALSGHWTTGHTGDTESDNTRTFEDSDGRGQMSNRVGSGCTMEEEDDEDTNGMEWMWLYCTCQYLLFMAIIACSARLCLRVRRTQTVAHIQGGARLCKHWSVSCCLRFTLGLVGALGGIMELPVTVVLNQRSPTCMYTCIPLVCVPLLIRHFTMFLVMLLSLDAHLQHLLAHRYSAVVTRRRALCVVLLCWVASTLASFAQFIGSGVLHTWRSSGADKGLGGLVPGTTGLGQGGGNWTTSLPTTPPYQKYYRDLKVIGKYLPYGGFLSKFYAEDKHNFTYAQIHGSHWGVCSADSLLSPHFLVYVYGITVFMLPLICLLGIYLNVLCMKPRGNADTSKNAFSQVRFLALSIFLLVTLCAPIHVIHSLALYSPETVVPPPVHGAAVYVFQVYSVVPQVLFTPVKKQANTLMEAFSLPAAPHHHPPLAAVDTARGKAVHMGLCGAVQTAQWASAKNTLKAKVCPDV